jgi:type VI secretion system protein ImpH
MASENGNKAEAVTLFREIQQEPYRFGFFQAVRRINCANSDMALTGTAFRPGDDPIRFAQTPYTEFAPSTLKSLDFDGPNGTPRLSQLFFGLFGPNGPLPTHLTEYARDRLRHNHDATFARFADMFHHRMVSLFYRSWAQAQPTVQHDRPEQDRFSMYVGALAGLGIPSFRDADSMPFAAKLHFAGHLSSLPTHATGLASMLESYFQVPAKIIEFVAHWLTIPQRDRLQLGRTPGLGMLGQTAVLGEKVWQRQDKFQVCLGPLSLEEYEAFLPSGQSFAGLVAAVRNYLGLELLWEVRLLLKGVEKPVTCLGKQGVLGWTSWLRTEEPEKTVGDLVLQVSNYADQKS